MRDEHHEAWQRFLGEVSAAHQGRHVHLEVDDRPLTASGRFHLARIALHPAHPPLREPEVQIDLRAEGEATLTHRVADPVVVTGYHDENQLDTIELVARSGQRTLLLFDAAAA